MTGFIPRTVVILGLASMLNDTASEMITPLLPLFLTVTLVSGLLVLPGVVVFGSLWQWIGLEVAFFTAAAVTVIFGAGYLMIIRR